MSSSSDRHSRSSRDQAPNRNGLDMDDGIGIDFSEPHQGHRGSNERSSHFLVLQRGDGRSRSSTTNTNSHHSSARDQSRDREPSSHYRDRDREKSSKWDRYRDTDWNCTECRSWNTQRDNRCFRCDYERPSSRGPDAQSRSFSEHLEDVRASVKETLDEFGRPKQRPKPDSTTPRWPPPFDKRSATYVFDARSGMFYHAISQFFFHPMTKLYFSNKEQRYYNHTPHTDPPFQPVEQQTDEQQHSETSTLVPTKAPAIAITLKTTTLPQINSTSTNSCTSTTAPSPERKNVPIKRPTVPTHKKYAANMERWSSRDKLHTKTGKPICPWCRRKFRDMSHLQRHDELSKRHEANVAKWKVQQDSKKDYRDRAWERRSLYGPDVAPLQVMQETEPCVSSTPHPEDILGEENIGNKMLQKLGWKSGKSLGRTGDATNHLEKDWERIETMARNAASGGKGV